MREFILPPFLRTSIVKYKKAPYKLPRKGGNPKAYPAMISMDHISNQYGTITLWVRYWHIHLDD